MTNKYTVNTPAVDTPARLFLEATKGKLSIDQHLIQLYEMTRSLSWPLMWHGIYAKQVAEQFVEETQGVI